MIAPGVAGADEDAAQALVEVLLTDHGAEDLRRYALRRFRRTMLFRNPPDHTRLRRLVSSVFTPRHVEALRPAVVRRIDALLDGFAGRDVVDIVTELALPLPVGVIGDLLGVPDVDLAVAAPWVRHLVAPLEPGADVAAVQGRGARRGPARRPCRRPARREAPPPRDDLLSRLGTARGEDQLDDHECVGTAILLLAAGFETTTNLIGNGLAALVGAPAQAALLRERPGLAGSAVQEMLRFDAPGQTDGRTALSDTVVGDVEVAGQVVLMVLGAGNRDPEVYIDPESLPITRRQAASLSFGGGLHFCLGAPLARDLGRTSCEKELAAPPGPLDGAEAGRPGVVRS